ncbi:hypothetical protein KCU81_g150, partial [Aureobasidium melanogenum]
MTSQHVPVRKQDEQVLSDDTSMFRFTKPTRSEDSHHLSIVCSLLLPLRDPSSSVSVSVSKRPPAPSSPTTRIVDERRLIYQRQGLLPEVDVLGEGVMLNLQRDRYGMQIHHVGPLRSELWLQLSWACCVRCLRRQGLVLRFASRQYWGQRSRQLSGFVGRHYRRTAEVTVCGQSCEPGSLGREHRVHRLWIVVHGQDTRGGGRMCRLLFHRIQAAKPAVAMVTVTTKGSQYPNADLPGRACLRRAASYRSIAFSFTSRIQLSHERVEVASKRYTPTPRFLAWSKCGRLRFSREILFAMRHISP